MNSELEERFLRAVQKTRGCWFYLGADQRQGASPQYTFENRSIQRVAYELWVDKIPEHMVVRTTCLEPRCTNPEHLFLDAPLHL